MTRKKMPVRSIVWLVGALLCLGFYAARAIHLPRRTPLGTERRLFGGTGHTLLRNPVSGRWLVSPLIAGPPTAAPPPPTAWSMLSDALTAFQWPGGAETGRTLAPFRRDGTWSIEPLGLRRVWRLNATGTIERIRHSYLSQSDPPAWLDLRTGRTYRNEAARRLPEPPPIDLLADGYGGSTIGIDEPTIDIPDLLPLDRGDATSPREVNNNRSVEVGSRRVFLFWNDPPIPGSGLYAASDHAAPRVLRLAERAAFTQLSPDGRTLFFERDGALWRLELRRPLPALLDEAVPPPLPEPTLDPPPVQ